MRASLLLLAPLLACGSSSSTPPVAPGNTTPAAVVTATLADDIAALTHAADPQSTAPWVQRATFLGWTATNQAAFRLLICAEDPLGGRGDYCDLDICVADRAIGQDVPRANCESAAAFALFDARDFDAVATTAAAEAATAALGALEAGTPGSLADTGLAIDHGTLLLAATGGRPPRVLNAAIPNDEGAEDLGKTLTVTASYAGTSPDGTCRVVLGLYEFMGWYEGVSGAIPSHFAAVTCD